MTPADLRAQADALHAEAEAAHARGDDRSAYVFLNQELLLRTLAGEMEARGQQTLTKGSVNVQDTEMTDAQLSRRGRAVARAAADRSTNALLKAITSDPRWGSSRVYCRDRLKIAPSSLTHYMAGVSPCPRRIDRMVREDFPEPFKDVKGKGPAFRWPRGVVE